MWFKSTRKEFPGWPGSKVQCNIHKNKIKYWEKTNLRSFVAGEKPHRCTKCDYSASEPAKIRRHMIKHSGEKPHKCSMCGYSTSAAANLMRHMRTHSERKT